VTYNDVDSVTFNDVAQTSSVNLAATRAPAAWALNNNVLNYNFSGAGKISGPVQLVMNGTAGLTLAESGGDNFSGGIMANSGTILLDDANCAISGGLTIASVATVQIGSNDANGALPSGPLDNEGMLVFNRLNNITVSVAMPGAGSLTQNGSGRLILSAASSYTGNTTVNAGTLALTNAGAIASSAQVSVTNAAMDVSGVSGSTTLTVLNLTNSTLTVKVGYLQTNLNVGSLNMGGTGNTINVRTLPSIAYYPAVLTLLKSANPISGYNFTLGSLPAGSVGTIAQSGDQTAVLLTLTSGPTNTRPSVTWSGSDGLTTGNTNWSDAFNWLSPGVPASTESVTFNNTAVVGGSPFNAVGDGIDGVVAAANINNAVNINLTNASLTYANSSGNFHNTQIASGKTLSLTGTLAVNGAGGTVTVLGAGGALNVSNPSNNTSVYVASGTIPTLDMSGLDVFNAAATQIGVGFNPTSSGSIVAGTCYLARTNVISTGSGFSGVGSSLVVGGANNSGAGDTGQLYLGQTNVIFTDGIVLGVGRSVNDVIAFNQTLTNPVAVFRGITGSSSRVTLWALGDATVNLNNSAPGSGHLNDFSAGTLDARVSTMVIGQGSQGNTALGAGLFTGTFNMGAGNLDVTTLKIAVTGGGSSGNGVGIMNVTHGTVLANSLGLAVVGAGGAAGTSGTLNLTNATLVISNGVSIGAGTAGATLSVISSTLKLLSGTLGTPAVQLTTLNLDGATLQLNVDGNATSPDIVATTINANNITTINLASIVNVSSPVQIPLISYTGTDPFSALTLGTHPAGYTITLVDNIGNSSVDVSIIPPAQSIPHFTGISVSGITLTISGTNGTGGGQYVLLGTTNLMLPLNQWVPLMTNNFAPDGSFNLSTNIINPALPRQFYILLQ
jgi:autotransporter-associated beta strand protein